MFDRGARKADRTAINNFRRVVTNDMLITRRHETVARLYSRVLLLITTEFPCRPASVRVSWIHLISSGRSKNNDGFLHTFDLYRNYYIKNVVLFEENSILPLPERLEASGVESVWGEVSQKSPKNRKNRKTSDYE